jgi:antibiotic biosynthesis monooxygenase (ABM) superfamily enzyme
MKTSASLARSSETLKKACMSSQSRRIVTGHDVSSKAVDSGDPQPLKKPNRWKQFLLTVSAVYPLTLLIPEVLRIISHVIPALREIVIKGILSATLLVASLLFVIIPLLDRVFKSWLNS